MALLGRATCFVSATPTALFAPRFARVALEAGGKLVVRHSRQTTPAHDDATNLDAGYRIPESLTARLADAAKVAKVLDDIELLTEYTVTPEGKHVFLVSDSELFLERKTLEGLERMLGLVSRLSSILK